jgi:hypothetical protein
MEKARAAGAAILAAHPHDSGPTPAVPFPTCYFARRWRELRGLFDRVETLQREPALQLGRGGRTAGRRLRRPASGRTASRLDDARSLRAGRRGARRLPTLVPARVPDPPRAAHPRARRVAGAGRYAVVQRCSHAGSAHDPREPLPRRVQPSSCTPPDPLPHVRVIDRDGTASRRSPEGRESRCAGRGRRGGEAAS